MENYVDLSNLPKLANGKISWKECNHNLVKFCYREIEDIFYVEKRIDGYNVLIRFHEKDIKMNILSIQRASLGKLYNFAVYDNYHHEVGEILFRQSCSIKILKLIRKSFSNNKKSKWYVVECLNCGNIFEISEANLDRGDGCPVCSNHKVLIGINDLWTTRPDIAMMLKNPEDGYRLMQYSNKEAEFICPICGQYIGKSYVHNVSRFGLSCPHCSDGVSYPNKLMYNLLTFLNQNFDFEVVFDWCVFPSYYDNEKMSYGRYDFVIHDKKIIIEMDGGIGHGNKPYSNSRYTQEELIYKDRMKDILAEQHGYKMIRIDCNYSSHDRFDYCVKNILDSELSKIIDLRNVDWNYINQESLSSNVIKAVNLHNQNISQNEICESLNISSSVLKDYLNKGKNLGMCV